MLKVTQGMCKEHKKKYVLYCVNCKIPLCEDCSNNHTKHKHLQDTELASEIKEEASYNNEQLAKAITYLRSIKEEIDKYNEVFESTCCDAKKAIQKIEESLIREISLIKESYKSYDSKLLNNEEINKNILRLLNEAESNKQIISQFSKEKVIFAIL